MEEFSFGTIEEVFDFLESNPDTPLPRQTYLGYPHFVYDMQNDELIYPCTVEIITAPNGDESLAWYRGKTEFFSDDMYDYLGKELTPDGRA